MSASGRRSTAPPDFGRTLVRRSIDFFNGEVYEFRRGEFIRIDAPTDAILSIHREWLLIELRSDWLTGGAEYRAGSLLAARLRGIPGRHSATERGVRTRRAHLPEPLRVDPRPAGGGHARRRREPRRGLHPGGLAGRTRHRAAGSHQHGDRHRRSRRRRNLPGFKRFRSRRRACCGAPRADGSSRSSRHRSSSTPRISPSHSISPHRMTAHRCRISSSATADGGAKQEP